MLLHLLDPRHINITTTRLKPDWKNRTYTQSQTSTFTTAVAQNVDESHDIDSSKTPAESYPSGFKTAIVSARVSPLLQPSFSMHMHRPHLNCLRRYASRCSSPEVRGIVRYTLHVPIQVQRLTESSCQDVD
jgi:hypothetical protein